MISIDNVHVVGFDHAIRGMRNPLNSWSKSDSEWSKDSVFNIGENDLGLMKRLANAGSTHAKYRRMITVYLDITAPLYWWKEFDTYKVGTVANSCSTMHKIAAKEFELKDFSYDHLLDQSIDILQLLIGVLNMYRAAYLKNKNKENWWQLIQLLPSSYNQKRTVMLNYEVLFHVYHDRKNHKLDEWNVLCDWIANLPYHEIITLDDEKENRNEE